MNLFQPVIDFILGFHKRESQACADAERETARKNQRLADIARERNSLKDRIEQAKRNKKAHRHLWVRLRELTNEEDRLEASR